MSDGQPWGKCAAFGCPLTGSFGRGDMWVCMCHLEANSGAFQGITKAIRDSIYLADATTDIRRYFGTDEWPAVYRQIQRRLIEAGRRDLLLSAPDCSPHREGRPIVKQWLARLEMELVKVTASARAGRYVSPSTVQTAAIAGPSHVSGYIEKNSGENHGS